MTPRSSWLGEGSRATRPRGPLYRALMRAQARAGDTRPARCASYERYRHALNEELGAEPAPQTQTLHAAIRAARSPTTDDRQPTTDEEPRIRGSRIEDRGSTIGTRDQETKTRRDSKLKTKTITSPFIGRVAELAALRDWIGDLADRRGGIVALVGEAGIGKTRLAEEALRLAEAGGALTIRLRCADAGARAAACAAGRCPTLAAARCARSGNCGACRRPI